MVGLRKRSTRQAVDFRPKSAESAATAAAHKTYSNGREHRFIWKLSITQAVTESYSVRPKTASRILSDGKARQGLFIKTFTFGAEGNVVRLVVVLTINLLPLHPKHAYTFTS